MFCPHCGTNNTSGQYCTKCGSSTIRQAEHEASPRSFDTVASMSPSTNTSNGFSNAAIALGAIAFLFFPVVLGPVGIILAAVGKSKNEPKAMIGLTVSIVGTVMGMIIGFIVASSF
jgi:hypothetical protein